MLESNDDITNLTDEFVRATGQLGNIRISTFWHVSEERAFDEFLVQTDEQCGHNAPEQENDCLLYTSDAADE